MIIIIMPIFVLAHVNYYSFVTLFLEEVIKTL